MRITVAICTWNRCDLLRQALEQLTRATVPEGAALEVIVVNNNCTDATDAVIEAFRARLPLSRVFEAKPGLSNARNAALDASTGDYVAFTDDDVLVDEGWLAALMEGVRAFPDATIVGGVIDPWFSEQPSPDLVEAFPVLKQGFCGLNHQREPGILPDGQDVWGANIACRASRIRGLRFDPVFGPSPTSSVGGDEVQFIRRVRAGGGTVVWWPSMRVRHHVDPARMTLEYLLRFMKGKGTQQVLLLGSQPAPVMFGIPRWLWRQYFTAYFGYITSCISSFDVAPYGLWLSGPIRSHASRRVRSLSWRREAAFVRGMVAGHRQLTSRQHALDAEVASQR